MSTPQQMAEAYGDKWATYGHDKNSSIQAFLAGYNARAGEQGLRWRNANEMQKTDDLIKHSNYIVWDTQTNSKGQGWFDEDFHFTWRGSSCPEILADDLWRLRILNESTPSEISTLTAVCSKTELTEIEKLTAERDRWKALSMLADTFLTKIKFGPPFNEEYLPGVKEDFEKYQQLKAKQ